MLQTNITLKNQEKIEKRLKEIVQETYEEVREEGYLLCMECGDVDLYITASNHVDLQDAIDENFELDECGDIIECKNHEQLMDDLYEYFLELHKNSGLFDFFPSGHYTVHGEKRLSDTDMLAPKNQYYAPFEDAKVEK